MQTLRRSIAAEGMGGGDVDTAVEAINSAFPPEVVAFSQPEYLAATLLGRVQ